VSLVILVAAAALAAYWPLEPRRRVQGPTERRGRLEALAR
jgi:hypothetical protein